uniref:Gelsolin-like domain-containing protein n=1 Tax=Anopheles funestus TaxID=62324 RepID=A0A4Y0BQM9_ANOFN
MNRLLVGTFLLSAVSIALIQGGTIASGPGRKLNIPAFNNAGKTVGLEVWRVENFQPVVIPKAEHGKFYTGDSYIVMNTKEDKNKVKSHDIHFWLGTKTTQDEAGSAAILSVQLDDLLGGVPVQHREVEGTESDLFLSYFKGGVRYLEGGRCQWLQARNHQRSTGAKRLFPHQGLEKHPRAAGRASGVGHEQGDCFILECGS